MPGPQPRDDWQEEFLEAFGLLGIQTEAARAARVSTKTVARERERNEAFEERFKESERLANGVLLRFLHDRGTTGQPVTRTERTTRTTTDKDGNKTVTVVEVEVSSRIISTPALLSLCKARMPELFDDRLRVVGNDGGAIQVAEVYREPTPERALELARVVVDLAQRREEKASAGAA